LLGKFVEDHSLTRLSSISSITLNALCYSIIFVSAFKMVKFVREMTLKQQHFHVSMELNKQLTRNLIILVLMCHNSRQDSLSKLPVNPTAPSDGHKRVCPRANHHLWPSPTAAGRSSKLLGNHLL
jgi:hypothetical protein